MDNNQAITPVPVLDPKTPSGFIFLLLTIIIILIGSTAYLLYRYRLLSKQIELLQIAPTPSLTPTPAPDPTSGWSIYTDPEGVFSFKYPADWTASKDVGILNDPTMRYILDVQAKTTDLDIQNWAKTNVCPIFASPDDSNGCTEFTKGPLENSIQVTFLAHYSGLHTVFKPDGTIFDVYLSAREPNLDFEEIKALYDQILSTFKFTVEKPSQQVLGIQLTQCCSCPTMIDSSQIGKSGWVPYEQRKDYTVMRPKICSSPNIGACAPCPPLETKRLPCQYNNKTYQDGEKVPADKCNSCSCDNGQVACTLMACE